MRAGRAAVAAVAVGVLVGGCGDDGDDVSARADGEASTTQATPPPPSVDTAPGDEPEPVAHPVSVEDLAGYDCDLLLAIVAEIAGPGDRAGEPFDPVWMTDTLRGGCVITGHEAVSIEVHLADSAAHSLPFLLVLPRTSEERAQQDLGIGDEAYANEDRTRLVARRGPVEVSLDKPFRIDGAEDGPLMDFDTMIAVAEVILDPWPSGPGAQTTRTGAPDLPVPAGADPADWQVIDVEELNQISIDAGGSAIFDPETSPLTWTLPIPGGSAAVDRYCGELHQAGHEAERAEALLERFVDGSAQPDDQSMAADTSCVGSDGTWFVIATTSHDGEGIVFAYPVDRFLRWLVACAADPARSGCE